MEIFEFIIRAAAYAVCIVLGVSGVIMQNHVQGIKYILYAVFLLHLIK